MEVSSKKVNTGFAKLATKISQGLTNTHLLAVQFMEITDKDDEKSKNKKKKLQKGWKSQQRFAKLDAETQKRQQSWMDFKKGKGSKKKVMCCAFSDSALQQTSPVAASAVHGSQMLCKRLHSCTLAWSCFIQ